MDVTADDYLRELQALLPAGPAWPREDGTTLTLLLTGLAQELARVNARTAALIEEADPRTTSELLIDWERVAGLPEPCLVGLPQTAQERRNSLVAKLTSIGGQSRQFFINLAASLGYAITITEFRPFRAGDPAGNAVYGANWYFTWRINAPAVTVTPFRAGKSAAGDPLNVWGNTRLECAINQRKPTHTTVIFGYS